LISMKGVIAGLISVAAVASWFFLLRPAMLGGCASYIDVKGISMEPTLHTGDLAVLRRQRTYQVGDIVAFHVEGGIVIHRIIGGTHEGYVVKGDNKEYPDQWRPTAAQIVGRMWLHIPGVGTFLYRMRQPPAFAVLLASVTALVLLSPARRARRRRKEGGTMSERRVKKNDGPAMAGGLMTGLAICLTAGVVFAGAAVFSFRQKAEQSQFVAQASYEHTAAFSYTVLMQASTLYPTGTLGPITPTSAGAEPVGKPTPVYTRLAHSLDLGFAYNIKGSPAPDVTGDVSAKLQITAGDGGWTQTLPLLATVPFSGPGVSFCVPVDFAQIWTLIGTVEKETGFTAGSYDVSVIPAVRVTGNVGAAALDEQYSPAFAMKFNRTVITLDSNLAQSEPKTIGSTVVQPRELTMMGLTMSVAMVRWVSTLLALFALMTAVILAMVIFQGMGLGKVAQIRAKYGGMLVSVDQAEFKEDGHKVAVTSIEDLVRMARTDGRPVLHQELRPRLHRYFVQDGTLAYEYFLVESR